MSSFPLPARFGIRSFRDADVRVCSSLCACLMSGLGGCLRRWGSLILSSAVLASRSLLHTGLGTVLACCLPCVPLFSVAVSSCCSVRDDAGDLSESPRLCLVWCSVLVLLAAHCRVWDQFNLRRINA